MNLIVSHPHDNEAIWLYLMLKKQNVPIELVSPEELLLAVEWKQTISNDEDSFYIKTKKGLEITNENLNFLFNRTQIAKSPAWEKAKNTEKLYVQAEMNALMMSWLHQVQQKSNIFNPTVGYSLSGVYWSTEQWAKAAFASGFNAIIDRKNQSKTETKNILVFGEKVIGNCATKKLMQNCIELSKRAKTPFLEIIVSKDETQFVSANTYPSLRAYGNRIITIIKDFIYEN